MRFDDTQHGRSRRTIDHRLPRRHSRRNPLLQRTGQRRRLLLDRDSSRLEPRARDARAWRPRTRRTDTGACHRGPAALGRDGQGRLCLGWLDLPPRRLRRHDGRRRHRAPARLVRAALRRPAAHRAARPELRRRRRGQGSRTVRPGRRPQGPVRRSAADQRRAGRRYPGLRLPARPAGGLSIRLQQPSVADRARLSALAGPAARLDIERRRTGAAHRRLHRRAQARRRAQRAATRQPGGDPVHRQDPGALAARQHELVDLPVPRPGAGAARRRQPLRQHRRRLQRLARRHAAQHRGAALSGRPGGGGQAGGRQRPERPGRRPDLEPACHRRSDRVRGTRIGLPRGARACRHGRAAGADLQPRIGAQLSGRRRVPGALRGAARLDRPRHAPQPLSARVPARQRP